MCKSKSEGGIRCDNKSPYKRSRTALKKAIRNTSASVSSLEESLTKLERAHNKYGPTVLHHEMAISPNVDVLLEELRSWNANPLIVGGAVRDSYLTGEEPKDIDIEVHDFPDMDTLAQKLKRAGFRVDEVGKAFGVLKTRLQDNTDIDISLPRKDNLTGSGHRDFTVTVDPDLTLSEAAARRDFTLNALYYDAENQVIVDPHQGCADLDNGVLRHISEAFSEDPLRVLRGFQIAARFDLRLSEDTAAVCQDIKQSFNHLSTERVEEEWGKFFTKGKNFEAGLNALRDSGWDSHFGLENIDIARASRDIHKTIQSARRHNFSPTVFGVSALALHIPEDRRQQFIKQVNIGNADRKKSSSLVAIGAPENMNSKKAVKAWSRELYKTHRLTVREWKTLHYSISDEAEQKRVKRIADIARKNASYHASIPDFVTGAMILEESQSTNGGKWVGELLKNARQAQDEEVFRNEASSREWVRKQLELFEE